MANLLPFETEKKSILIKKEAETNQNYGCDPNKREITELIRNGIINLDKPSGPTSHQVSYWVKDILKVNKVGHGGTLDPAVTGILPIAIENATKIIQAFLYSGKEYIALMHLHKDSTSDEVKKVVSHFTGKLTQLPPLRSKVKRVEREREIYYIDFLDMSSRDVLFKVGCQAGTYVRRLCEQIGKELGTGAHMIQLRRTKAGGFTEKDNLVTLQDLLDAVYFWRNEQNEKFLRYCIQPVENAVKFLPHVWVFDSAVDSLCHGAKLSVPGISKLESNVKKDKIIAVMTLKNELIGIGKALMDADEILVSEKGIAVQMDRVSMNIGTYPKFVKN